MIYKTDMHVHSRDISLCADAPVEFIVQKYTEYGYSTVVLCNHFERYTMKSGKDKSYRDFVRRYAAAYEKLKDAAGDRLHVLLGAEVRFDENINDYLLYGVTEEKLLALPDIWKMGVQKLHEEIAGMDMLLVQAHPFRKK